MPLIYLQILYFFIIKLFTVLSVNRTQGRDTLGDVHVTATHGREKSLFVKSQATSCNKSLCVYERIFVNSLLTATEFCRHNKLHKFTTIVLSIALTIYQSSFCSYINYENYEVL